MNNTQKPFLYRMFNIFYFFTSQLLNNRNILLRVINAFTEGLNRRQFLPRYVIIFLDADLLKFFNTDAQGITRQMETCIKWLAKEMNKLIETRKEQFADIKPGALPSSDDFPTLIWIKVYDRPYTRNNFITENRGKFNRGINEVALREKNCRVMSIESLGIQHFNSLGNLNYEGKKQLWREINHQMQDFFRNRTRLNPRYYMPNLSHRDQRQAVETNRCDQQLNRGLPVRD